MASELRRIFHLSDIHFGLENNRALDWVKQEIAEQRPDAVAITGDLTMRARHREFAAATQWINSLAAPVTVEVGNHDMPYFNLLERFLGGMVFKRVFRDIDVRGLDRVRQWAQGHEIIYMPSHRSHADYLLVSYALYHGGLVPPHIAAGINLNFWPVGGLLRRCGADCGVLSTGESLIPTLHGFLERRAGGGA